MRYVSNSLMDINYPLVLMAIYDIFDVFSNEMCLIYTKKYIIYQYMRHKIKIIHKTTTSVWDREFSPSKICLV